MTTIVWHNGEMAADGRVTCDGLVLTDTCKKIRKLSDGSLFALAGDAQIEERLVEWLEDADVSMPPQGKGFTALLVSPDGALSFYEGEGDRFLPWYSDGPVAIGSGDCYAYGALEMGATAFQAVQCAARRNTGTGGVIQVERPGLPDEEDDE